MGVDQLETHGGEISRRHGGIAAPAIGPVADEDVGVERTAGGVAIEVNAVVEGHGGHFGILDHLGNSVDIGHIVAVLAGGLEVAEAHGAGGEYVIGIFIRAHVEVLAALARKVADVLLQQGLGKGHGGGVGHVDGTGRAAIGAVLPRQSRGCGQDGVHVARGVDTGNHAHALGGGVGDDFVHLGLGQLIHVEVVIRLIAGVDGGRHPLAAVRLPVYRQGHIVQQEAQAIVAHGQLDIVKSSRRRIVDDLLDAVDAEILAAAVQEHDVVLVAGVFRVTRLGAGRGSECGDGQQPDHQNHRQNQRQQSLPRRSCLRLVHFVHSFPLYVIFHCPVRGAAETSPARFQAL